MKKIFITILLTLFFSQWLRAQVDFRQIEQELITTIKILQTAHQEQDAERQILFSEKLKKQILFVLVQRGSFYYNFSELSYYMTIHYSPDFRIRTFSWLGRDRGNYFEIENAIQYQNQNKKAMAELLPSYGGVVQSIFVTKDKQGNQFYGLLSKFYSTLGYHSSHCQLYTIKNNKLLSCKKKFNIGDQITIKKTIDLDTNIKYDARRKILYYLDENQIWIRWYWIGDRFRK